MTRTANDNLPAIVPARRPDQHMPVPLGRGGAVRLITEAYPISEAAKLGLAQDVLLYLSDGDVGTWVSGQVHNGEPLWQGMQAWDAEGFTPRYFALFPAAPIDGVTV